MTWKNRITGSGEVDPAGLIPNPRNWRKHPKKQADGLLGALEEIGWVQDVIVNGRTGHLVDGHLRVELAIQNNEKMVPVKYVDLTEEEEATILATLDPITAMAGLDKESLKGLLESIDTENPALQDLLKDLHGDILFPSGGPEDAGTQMNLAKELMKKWAVKEGQVWQMGPHRILCGDATRKEDLDALLQGDGVDLVLTDPPYGISIVTKKKVGPGGKLGFGKIRGKNIVEANLYPDVIGDNSTESARAALSLLKDIPNKVIFGGNYFTDFLPISRCWIVWDKREEVGGSANFADCELAWTSFDKLTRIYRHLWSGLLRKGDRKNEGARRIHPTQKPVGLFTTILGDFSQEGDTVLDPFLGSGTTLIACENLKRICRGIEITPEYMAVTLQRYKDTFGKEPELAA